MAKKTNSPSKRLGSRYGLTVRRKLDKIEREQKKKQKCPYCNKMSAKRISWGIFECKKCGAKFTSKAYFVSKKSSKSKSQKEEGLEDEMIEEKEKIEEKTV